MYDLCRGEMFSESWLLGSSSSFVLHAAPMEEEGLVEDGV